MGFGRFILRLVVPGYNAYRLAGKVMEKGVVDGVKEDVYERVCEDDPVGSYLYNSGKNKGHTEGMKEGYNRASNKYEEKLLKQADTFSKVSLKVRLHCEEYMAMMAEYESYIAECEKIIKELPKSKQRLLERMKDKYAALIAQEPPCDSN